MREPLPAPGPHGRVRRVVETVRRVLRLMSRFLHAVWNRIRRPVMVLGVAVLAYGGAMVAMAYAGATSRPVGPVETTMRLVPSWTGESVLSIPPLGTLTLDTHDSPVQLEVTVDRINQESAARIVRDPQLLENLESEIVSDIQEGVQATAVKSFVVGTLGATLTTLIVVRRRQATLAAGGAAAVAIAAVFGLAAQTLNPRAIAEPKYSGLLTGAPSLIGNAQDLAENFDAYSQELVRLVTNVTKLYDATSTLPSYEPDEDVIRLLHVSDLHLGEHAWDVISSVTRQYSIDLIVDSGDITDHGTEAENYFLQRIPSLQVPYVWVRGNHDSVATEHAMRQLPNVVVLDGTVRTVKGIRFLGAGDPRFTPDRSNRDVKKETEAVAAQAIAIARVAEEADPPVDIIVYHSSDGASFLDGKASLILTGDGHERYHAVLPGGSRLMQQGTTGGAGLRALEKDEPAPIEMSVLYLDRSTLQLEAWDDITLGGLGLTSARIDRHQVQPTEEPTTPSPIPTPTGPLPDSPLPTPTITRTPTPTPELTSPSPGGPVTPGQATPGMDGSPPPEGTPESANTESANTPEAGPPGAPQALGIGTVPGALATPGPAGSPPG